MPRKTQKQEAQEAVVAIRRTMKTDPDMKLAVAALTSSRGCGLGELAMTDPKLVIGLAESWAELEETPAYSGNPETGVPWS